MATFVPVMLTVGLEPVTILSVGVSGGAVVARCRVAGSTAALEILTTP